MHMLDKYLVIYLYFPQNSEKKIYLWIFNCKIFPFVHGRLLLKFIFVSWEGLLFCIVVCTASCTSLFHDWALRYHTCTTLGHQMWNMVFFLLLFFKLIFMDEDTFCFLEKLISDDTDRVVFICINSYTICFDPFDHLILSKPGLSLSSIWKS